MDQKSLKLLQSLGLETINAIKTAEQSSNYVYIAQYKHALNCNACTDNTCSSMKSKMLHSTNCKKKDCINCYDINLLGIANRIYEGLLAKKQMIKQAKYQQDHEYQFTDGQRCQFIGAGGGGATNTNTNTNTTSIRTSRGSAFR